MEQPDKARLAQLGKDRRLAEAVAGLDQAANELVRIAADSNATDDDVLQGAAEYRGAVQRRNIAFDKACGDAERPPVDAGDRASGPVEPPVPPESAAPGAPPAGAKAETPPAGKAEPKKPEGKPEGGAAKPA